MRISDWSSDVCSSDLLLGPNGAGKSTLIGIVSSLVNKTSGEVRVFGVDLHARRDEAMRLIGLVPQELNFNMFEKPLDILVNYAGFYGIAREIGRATSELQSLMRISYAVFCLKKKKHKNTDTYNHNLMP